MKGNGKSQEKMRGGPLIFSWKSLIGKSKEMREGEHYSRLRIFYVLEAIKKLRKMKRKIPSRTVAEMF